jgi:hypothetical protein
MHWEITRQHHHSGVPPPGINLHLDREGLNAIDIPQWILLEQAEHGSDLGEKIVTQALLPGLILDRRPRRIRRNGIKEWGGSL